MGLYDGCSLVWKVTMRQARCGPGGVGQEPRPCARDLTRVCQSCGMMHREFLPVIEQMKELGVSVAQESLKGLMTFALLYEYFGMELWAS